MNTREVLAKVKDLASERGWPEGSPLEVMLLSLYSAREDARHQLNSHLTSLSRDIARLQKMLVSPSPILNTLGELQGRPPMVEAAVGAFYEADRSLRVFLENFPKD